MVVSNDDMFSVQQGPHTLEVTGGRYECTKLVDGILSGDCDGSGDVNMSDALSVLEAIFNGDRTEKACGDGTIRDPANVTVNDFDASEDLRSATPSVFSAGSFWAGVGTLSGWSASKSQAARHFAREAWRSVIAFSTCERYLERSKATR